MLNNKLIGMYSHYENEEELKGLVIEFREGGFINQDIADLVGMPISTLKKRINKWSLSLRQDSNITTGIFKTHEELINNIKMLRLDGKARKEICNNTGISLHQLISIIAKHDLCFSSSGIIKERLTYNKYTGEFIWKNGKNADKVAGHVTPDGYIIISVNSKAYKAHRLAFLFMGCELASDEQADHIDHNRSNNAWINLARVSILENMHNLSLRKDNKSGQVGVSLNNGKWVVRIKIPNSKYFYQRSFSIKEEAIQVAKEKYKEFGYHENHGKPNKIQYNNTKRSELIKQQTPENMNKDLMKLILDNTPEGYHDDHIVPLSKGGKHEPNNIQYITEQENLEKGNKLDYICKTAINPIEYLKDIQIIV